MGVMTILDNLKVDRGEAQRRTQCRNRGCACSLHGPVTGEMLEGTINGSPRCTGVKGQCGCVHAEARMIIWALKHGRCNLTMLVTLSPCTHCANLIVESGAVKRVFFLEEYDTDPQGLWIIRGAGIECRRPLEGERL